MLSLCSTAQLIVLSLCAAANLAPVKCIYSVHGCDATPAPLLQVADLLQLCAWLEEEVDSLGDQLEQEQEDKARQLVCFIPISFAVHYPFLSANTCTTSSSTLWQFESV